MNGPHDLPGRVLSAYEEDEKLYDGIQLAPEWSAHINKEHIELSQPGIAPDAADPQPGVMFPGGITLDMPRRKGDPEQLSPLDACKAVIVATSVAAMHEALEWVTLDGKQLAIPHPYDEEFMWAWMTEQMLKTLNSYIENWPLADAYEGAKIEP